MTGVRRHHHLNRRERDGLSEADARQVHAFDVPRRDEDARRLPRQVNARLFAQPERRQVAVERIRPHPQRQLDKHRVAAVFQPVRHRLRAVRTPPAADGVAVDGDFRRAVERILRRCHPAVQRGCRRENFERAARLVNVGNRGQAHQLRQRLRVVARRIVRVVARVHAHRQNRARFHVADKADDRLRLIDLDALAHRLFDHLLNFRVNRQHQTAPPAATGCTSLPCRPTADCARPPAADSCPPCRAGHPHSRFPARTAPRCPPSSSPALG